MNDKIINAWAELVKLAGIATSDVVQFMNGNIVTLDFLRMMNAKLANIGSEKSIEAVELLLPAYPPTTTYSVSYSIGTINEIIEQRSPRYEAGAIPLLFTISPDENSVIDLLGSLTSLSKEGLRLSGIKVEYADSGVSLQLIIFLDTTDYKMSGSSIAEHDTGSHDVEFAFISEVIPVIKYADFEYRFLPMKDSYNPWKILYYCWKNRLGKDVNRDELRAKAKVNSNVSINEMLRKSSMVKDILYPFIQASPNAITLNSRAYVNADYIKCIQSMAVKSVPISE